MAKDLFGKVENVMQNVNTQKTDPAGHVHRLDGKVDYLMDQTGFGQPAFNSGYRSPAFHQRIQTFRVHRLPVGFLRGPWYATTSFRAFITIFQVC
ncbi:hypothetical protein [Desulfosarcina ovata]|uniref:hypothetical protein n=1 Tax=Desulfosarcina ovata TaxID=83564 RepID=UPI0012D2E3A8|nr:hypothetical protein [Desulfosarcina ovata]